MKRILLVEDEPGLVLTLSDRLAREGYAVESSGDGESGLERASGEVFDLVILDEAPPGVAYRAFRDGRVIVEKNHRALVDRKVRAILECLGFRPIEALVARVPLPRR